MSSLKQGFILTIGLLGYSVWAQAQVVGTDQWLSRKAMACDVNNTHLLQLSTAVTHSDDTFHYRYDANKPQSPVDKTAY